MRIVVRVDLIAHIYHTEELKEVNYKRLYSDFPDVNIIRLDSAKNSGKYSEESKNSGRFSLILN